MTRGTISYFNDGACRPNRLATDGEVEDYIATILDGSIAPPVVLSPSEVDTDLIIGTSRTLLLSSGTTDTFLVDNDQVSAIRYEPLETTESLVLSLSENASLSSDQISFGAFASNSRLRVFGEGATVDLTNSTTAQAADGLRLDLSLDSGSTVV